MITLKRNGREYEITEEDQKRILDIALSNGGDIKAASMQLFEEKYKCKMCNGAGYTKAPRPISNPACVECKGTGYNQ
jgi:DnaJ-class molecular chaperone